MSKFSELRKRPSLYNENKNRRLPGNFGSLQIQTATTAGLLEGDTVRAAKIIIELLN